MILGAPAVILMSCGDVEPEYQELYSEADLLLLGSQISLVLCSTCDLW